MILTTRDDQSMTDEDRTFRAWIDPSTSYSAAAVMWWLPGRLFEWPTVTRPWPTKWSWVGVRISSVTATEARIIGEHDDERSLVIDLTRRGHRADV